MIKNYFAILILTALSFVACKKDNTEPIVSKNPTPVPTTPVADFTITASDINYPVGTTWVYHITTIDEHIYNNVPSANQSFTTYTTFTVTVDRDTIISTNITGKILNYYATGLDHVNNYVKEVLFYDPYDLKWHDIDYQKINGGTETVGCLGIDLPLTSNSLWQNTHTSHPSSGIDSCYAAGFENALCGIGNIKCIKFNTKYSSNIYWYNNTYGRVKTETFSAQMINPTESTSKTIITTLSSFHN